jgi:hypothetical protein
MRAGTGLVGPLVACANKKDITDLQNTADKWVTRDLRLISG